MKKAIGFSFLRKPETLFAGTAIMAATFSILLISIRTGAIAISILILWLLGATSAAMVASYFGEILFIRRICYSCRLRNIVIEHELLHARGEYSDEKIWEAMRKKYDTRRLNLIEDRAICSFCPIKKRLLSGEASNGPQGSCC